ncbi:MAG: magnesium transporter [Butyrivibrio sp.]|nr:magnesium transporter [Butyrivibrio sp.]
MNEKNIAAEVSVHTDYITEITEIFRNNLTPKIMLERLSAYHENDIAGALDLLTKDERAGLYRILDAEVLAGVLEYSDKMNEYLDELNVRKKIDVLSSMEASEAVEYLRALEKGEREMLLELMDDDIKSEIKMFSSFDEDEIGSKMTTNYISVREGASVKQAMSALIEQAADNDNISTIYVVDNNDMLVGAVDLKDLIISREASRLSDITVTSYPYVYANEQIGDSLERIKNYSEDSIPVLDTENKLRGVLISQDIALLVDDEMGDDYAKLAGLSAEEDLNEPLKRSIAKRLPWLFVLLGLGLVVSTVVGSFEKVVAHLAVIVSFQSLILDMAGNTGTQSLAVTIRVLMDERIGGRQKLKLISKEARIGLLNGLILGALSVAFVGIYLIFFKRQPAALAFSVSVCVGTALLVSLVLSSIIGTIVPIIFSKLKIDPAVASGPLITTVNDLVAVVTYYGLAWTLLINILGV